MTNTTPRFRRILPGVYTLQWTDVEIARDDASGFWQVLKGVGQSLELVSLAETLRDAKAIALSVA